MKKLLGLCLVLGLIGCLGDASTVHHESTDSDEVTTDNQIDLSSPGDSFSDCAPYLEQIKFGDETYTVIIPSLCNLEPYILRGDPERGEEITDPDLREQIMNLIPHEANIE